MASRVTRGSASAAVGTAILHGCPELPPGDLWVFGYGSLMWDPQFDYSSTAPALLRGYHRAFCIHSVRFRGTPERPGLVLGLDRGGACRGIAFRIPRAGARAALERLWAREMSRFVYRARLLPVDLGSRKVRALAFVADRAHPGYAGLLEPEAVARTIASCRGAGGPNVDYLVNTLRHLEALGIRERRLHRLLQTVQSLRPEGP